MPAPRLARCLPATAILGAGLVLGTATPAVAEPAPMATVVARGERDATTGPTSTTQDPLLLLVVAGGLAIGAGGALSARRRVRT
jgi:hypothetical protein